MTHAAFGVVSFLVFLCLWGKATAVLFNFTDALSPWLESWTNTPSAEASSNLQLLQNNQNSTATLGTILFNSVSQNQSYAVAEAVRFALLPSSDFNAADPADAPAYQALTANIGAATAYAMHYAAQKAGGLPGGLASTEAPAPPPTAGGPIMRGGPDPPVAVQPSATDIFNAMAAGALGAVASSCDATWACHISGCLDTPDKLLQKKRADTCCYLVGPLLRGIERQLTLFGEEALLGNALSPNVTAQDPFNLGFLDRCVWYKNEPDISSNAPVGCNSNTANYMGKIVRMDVNSQTPGAPIVATAADCCAACVADVQCNVWVFCGKAWGCAGCNWQAINYDVATSLGADPLQRFGPYGPGCSQPNGLFPLGTCTLKSATFKDVPSAYASPAASYFLSGHLKQHNAQRH